MKDNGHKMGRCAMKGLERVRSFFKVIRKQVET